MADKLTANKCANCHAPLTVAPDATVVRCQYCGNTMQVERAKPKVTRMAGPPPTNVIYVAPVRSGMATLMIVAFSIVPVLIAVGSVAFSSLRGHFVSLPATCAINESITISGKTFDGPGTAITAETNCKIKIKDSKIKADTIVEGKLNVEITLENSTLEAKKTAIVLEHNGKVKLSGKSSVSGAENGIEGSYNLEVAVEDSKLSGGESGVKGDSGLKVKAKNGTISGKDSAVACESNGTVTVEAGGVLTSEAAAVRNKSSLTLEVEGGSVDGGEVAVSSESNPKIKVTKKGKVTSAKGNAIEGGSNMDLTVDDGTVEAGDTAVKASSNGKVKVVKGGRIKGGSVGIDSQSNFELTMQSGTVESPGVAVQSKSNARIDARKSTITGGQNAFLMEREPSSMSLTETNVTGPQVFNGKVQSKPPTPQPPSTPAAAKTPAAATTTNAPAAPKPAALPPFDGAAATAALDAATKKAQTSCHATGGKPVRVMIDPGWLPDGSNAKALVRNPELKGTPEAACVESVFRALKIPAFDEKTLNSGMLRFVNLT
jgi:DNA-directed RNA polymerase subunit RPC12/RpoP